MLSAQEEVLEQAVDEKEDEQQLEEKITQNKTEKPQKNQESAISKYVIDIPTGTKLEQIHKLKEFLSAQTP
jgi:hypothetical protein